MASAIGYGRNMLSPFDFNLRHLRAVPLIHSTGSICAAANAANLSQPALTQGLAKIERQLGEQIFDRRSNGMVATRTGTQFVERIDAALRFLAAGTQQAARHRRGFARPDMLITSTQARAFLALADAGSFIEASRTTGWSQPALHRAVRDLEQLCGVAMIDRRGRGIAVNAEGKRLARGIRLMAVELSSAIIEAQPHAPDKGRLIIGAMPLSRARLLPQAIAALFRAAPGITVNVVEGSWRELVEPLRDGEIDLMIGALRPESPPELEQEPLMLDELAVIARSGHPLAAARAVRSEDLAAYPWIVGSPGAPVRSKWEQLFHGVPLPAAPIECGSVMTIRGILFGTDCLTLLSPDQVRVELDGGLLAAIGGTRAEMTREIGLTTRTGWRPTAVQSQFLELLRDAARGSLPIEFHE